MCMCSFSVGLVCLLEIFFFLLCKIIIIYRSFCVCSNVKSIVKSPYILSRLSSFFSSSNFCAFSQLVIRSMHSIQIGQLDWKNWLAFLLIAVRVKCMMRKKKNQQKDSPGLTKTNGTELEQKKTVCCVDNKYSESEARSGKILLLDFVFSRALSRSLSLFKVCIAVVVNFYLFLLRVCFFSLSLVQVCFA